MYLPQKKLKFIKNNLEIVFLLLTALTSVILVFLVVNFKNQKYFDIAFPNVDSELKKFESENERQKDIVDLEQTQFINPEAILPDYTKYNSSEVKIIFNLIKGICTKTSSVAKIENPILAKSVLFHKLQCSGKNFKDELLVGDPIFSVQGDTFAYLEFKNKFSKNINVDELKKWVNDKIYHFHVLEIQQIQKNLNYLVLDYKKRILLELGWEELYNLSQFQDILVTDKYVFIKNKSFEYKYNFYTKTIWEEYWDSTVLSPIILSENTDYGVCYLVSNNICWKVNSTQLFLKKLSFFNILFIIMIVVTVSLFLMVGFLIVKRKNEREKFKFLLEMLTHELRTPLSNLNFIAEEYRNIFDQLNSDSQQLTLKLFDQLARVMRITESTQNYLENKSEIKFIKPKLIAINSLEKFVKQTIDSYSTEIKFHYKNNEEIDSINSKIFMDPFWVQFCVLNLIKNAITHGQPPVSVNLEYHHQYWVFSVADQGMDPFNVTQKSSTSKGMGLGLNLMSKILPYINGKLILKYSPTRFYLIMSNGKENLTPNILKEWSDNDSIIIG